jgi:hypothetical protein
MSRNKVCRCGSACPDSRRSAPRPGPRHRQAVRSHPPGRVGPGRLRRASPYAYVGDRAPGQAHGNGLNLNGGLWHEVTASGRMG